MGMPDDPAYSPPWWYWPIRASQAMPGVAPWQWESDDASPDEREAWMRRVLAAEKAQIGAQRATTESLDTTSSA